MVVVSRFHHHWATRVGLLLVMGMIFAARPAGEEALTSSIGICMLMRRRRTVMLVRMILRKGGIAVPHVLMIRIVVKTSALRISRIEVASGRGHLSDFSARHRLSRRSVEALIVVGDLLLLNLLVLEIGKVIHRYLGRQGLLVAGAAVWQGAIIIVAVSLSTRGDRRRAVEPGPLRAGGARRGGVERSAKFL